MDDKQFLELLHQLKCSEASLIESLAKLNRTIQAVGAAMCTVMTHEGEVIMPGFSETDQKQLWVNQADRPEKA